MKHLRSDYDAIQPFPQRRAKIAKIEGETVNLDQDPTEKWLGLHMDPLIGEDEPVFLLRAKDPVAGDVVRYWAERVAQRGGDPVLVGRVDRWANEMDDWRREHGDERTVPDVPKESLRG